MATPGAGRRASSVALTVADLLNRAETGPARGDTAPVDAESALTVGSLLRREGRAPHAVDRPVRPRQSADEEPGTDRRAVVRRGAVAAGALLAAGSVFGAAALTDTAVTSPFLGEDGGAYPGQGRLDTPGAQASAPNTVALGPAAAATALDPGIAAPANWVPVAFPSAAASAPVGNTSGPVGGGQSGAALVGGGNEPATNAGDAPAPAAGDPTPAPAQSGDRSSSLLPPVLTGGSGLLPPVLGGGRDSGGDDSSGSDRSPSRTPSLGDTVTDTTGDLGHVVGGLTDAAPGPVDDAANSLGDAVGGAGKVVGGTVSGLGETVKAAPKALQSVTAPVEKALPVLKPVTSLLVGTPDSASSSAPRTSSEQGSSGSESEEPSSPQHVLDGEDQQSGGRHAKADDESGSASDSGSDESGDGVVERVGKHVKDLVGGASGSHASADGGKSVDGDSKAGKGKSDGGKAGKGKTGSKDQGGSHGVLGTVTDAAGSLLGSH